VEGTVECPNRKTLSKPAKHINVELLKALVRTVPDFPKTRHSVLRHHHAAQRQDRLCAN